MAPDTATTSNPAVVASSSQDAVSAPTHPQSTSAHPTTNTNPTFDVKVSDLNGTNDMPNSMEDGAPLSATGVSTSAPLDFVQPKEEPVDYGGSAPDSHEADNDDDDYSDFELLEGEPEGFGTARKAAASAREESQLSRNGAELNLHQCWIDIIQGGSRLSRSGVSHSL